MHGLGSCNEDGDFWITAVVLFAVVLGMSALGLALAASRLGRWFAFATLGAAALTVLAGVLVGARVLPSGTNMRPEVTDWYAEEDARLTSREGHERRKREWQAARLHDCTLSGAEWAAAPLFLGLAALGVAYARRRALTSSR